MARKPLFITGACSGIGAATARAAERGWNVTLFTRSADKHDILAGEISDAAHTIAGDVADLDELIAAVAETVGHFGGLDAAFANAGRGSTRLARSRATPPSGAR